MRTEVEERLMRAREVRVEVARKAAELRRRAEVLEAWLRRADEEEFDGAAGSEEKK